MGIPELSPTWRSALYKEFYCESPSRLRSALSQSTPSIAQISEEGAVVGALFYQPLGAKGPIQLIAMFGNPIDLASPNFRQALGFSLSLLKNDDEVDLFWFSRDGGPGPLPTDGERVHPKLYRVDRFFDDGGSLFAYKNTI